MHPCMPTPCPHILMRLNIQGERENCTSLELHGNADRDILSSRRQPKRVQWAGRACMGQHENPPLDCTISEAEPQFLLNSNQEKNMHSLKALLEKQTATALLSMPTFRCLNPPPSPRTCPLSWEEDLRAHRRTQERKVTFGTSFKTS